jgi:hypothetical protein
MAAVVAAVRAEEAKFKDIEYVARTTVRDPNRKDPANPSDVTTLATSRVVVQGDRTFYRYQAFERVGIIKYRIEEVSACDGERTRTVVADNCANIHLGRWRHPRLVPIHSLPLSYERIHVPLSIYLGGSEAIHAYLGYTREMIESGSWDVFRKVEARLEGEEQVDGLRCLKVRIYRWYQPNNTPFTQHLWLAPERNYHCVREQYRFGNQLYEMRVHEWREAAPEVWYPARITAVVRNAQGQRGLGRAQANTTTETAVEAIELARRREATFFRDVTIPPDLPVFTIKDRKPVGSMLPDPFDDDWGRRKLDELAARVGAEEDRHDEFEVRTRSITRYPRTYGAAPNVRYDEIVERHSIVRGDRAYLEWRNRVDMPGAVPNVQLTAYDGEWTRYVAGQDTRNLQGVGVSLRRGRQKGAWGFPSGIFVHRSHTLLLNTNWCFGSLAELLAAKPQIPTNQTYYHFRYCGAAEVDGRPCIEVRGDSALPNWNATGGIVVVYLATDRDDLPVRIERYDNPFGRTLMPTSIVRCDEFREVAPGLWYPARLTELSFDPWAQAVDGRLVLDHRRETVVESIGSAARIGVAAFREVVAPAGAQVQVQDEAGQQFGVFPQPEDGVVSLTLKGYLKLASEEPLNVWQRQARGQALDALVGKPAPGFPRGATWLNGQPKTWEALRGRVVLLGFWAEWSDACRDDLVRLERLHRDRADGGLAIIGVHLPGSEPADIKKVVDALHLEFPICIDAEGPGGADAWGQLSGHFAVRSVPQAAIVNREGKIVACGRLEDVLARTRVLVQQGR